MHSVVYVMASVSLSITSWCSIEANERIQLVLGT